MNTKQRCLDAADEFNRKVVLSVDEGDEELAAQYRLAMRLLLEAVDGHGMFDHLYRLVCFANGEPLQVRGVRFFRANGLWTNGKRYPSGKHKGELIMRLSSEFFLKFLRGVHMKVLSHGLPGLSEVGGAK